MTIHVDDFHSEVQVEGSPPNSAGAGSGANTDPDRWVREQREVLRAIARDRARTRAEDYGD